MFASQEGRLGARTPAATDQSHRNTLPDARQQLWVKWALGDYHYLRCSMSLTSFFYLEGSVDLRWTDWNPEDVLYLIEISPMVFGIDELMCVYDATFISTWNKKHAQFKHLRICVAWLKLIQLFWQRRLVMFVNVCLLFFSIENRIDLSF